MLGSRLKELHLALVGAFTESDLTRLVKFDLERDLAAIVKLGTFEDVVFELIMAALRQGWLDKLIVAACAARPDRPDLQSFRSDPEVLAAKLGRVEGKLDDLKRLQLKMAFQLSRDLLGMRYKAYGRLWARTEPTMIYTADAFGPKTVSDLMESLSGWYFSEAGGIFLTTRARDYYFALQELVQDVCGFGDWAFYPRRPKPKPKELFVELVGGLDLEDGLKGRLMAQLKDQPDDQAGAKKEWHESIDPAEWRTCCRKVSDRLRSLVDGKDKDAEAGAKVFAAIQQVASILRTTLVYDLGSRLDVKRPAARGAAEPGAAPDRGGRQSVRDS